MHEKILRTKSRITQVTESQCSAIDAGSDTSGQMSHDALGKASESASLGRSGREIARENEVAALHALNKFGWLPSRQLAAWLWPTRTQQVQMVRRTLNRLRQQGQLLVCTLPNGIPAYALSTSGAARLRERGVEAKSGKDLRLGRWQHRAICNWHCIVLRGMGYEIFTEHELYTGRSLVANWHGKLADVIGISSRGFRWVEVEHSRRRPSDMRKLLHLLIQAPLHPSYTHDMSLEGVELVTTDVTLTNAIAAALQKEMKSLEMSEVDQLVISRRVIVTELQISSGLRITAQPKSSLLID